MKIPYKAKSGEPMSYFILTEDGSHITTTRAECLANSENKTYPQRWFVDEESGLVVRLPQNETGEEIARANMQSIWTQEKQAERAVSCVDKYTARCPFDCGNCQMSHYCDSEHRSANGLKCAKKCEGCQRNNTRRIADLDDSAGEGLFADGCDFTTVFEDKAMLDFLYTALRSLLKKWEQELIKDIFWNKKTERELVDKYGFTSINYHKKRILQMLKKYFEENF